MKMMVRCFELLVDRFLTSKLVKPVLITMVVRSPFVNGLVTGYLFYFKGVFLY